jgi:phosphoesterase RecJ-like protein
LALGLSRLGKKVDVWIKDGVPGYLMFLLGAKDVLSGPFPVSKSYEMLVVLDSGEFERIGETRKSVESAFGCIVNIDHHATNTRFGDLNWVDPGAAATGEMIFFLLTRLGLRIIPEIAECLLAAISADTGSFKYSNTTDCTFFIASELVRSGANPEKVGMALHNFYPREKILLMSKVFATLETFGNERIALVSVLKAMLEECGAKQEHTEGFVDTIRGIPGVEVACLLREVTASSTKISLRSNGKMDVAEVCEVFGGGGHKMAAGAVLSCPLKEAKDRLLQHLLRQIA